MIDRLALRVAFLLISHTFSLISCLQTFIWPALYTPPKITSFYINSEITISDLLNKDAYKYDESNWWKQLSQKWIKSYAMQTCMHVLHQKIYEIYLPSLLAVILFFHRGEKFWGKSATFRIFKLQQDSSSTLPFFLSTLFNVFSNSHSIINLVQALVVIKLSTQTKSGVEH